MKNKRALFFRIGAIAVLIAICALMMIVGRGHTVYLDNKPLEYNGTACEAPYKISIYVGDEQITKLYEGERGEATNIGQTFKVTFKVMQTKGGAETTDTYQIKLPYDMDGIVVNIPGFLAGVPEDTYISEFVSAIPEPVEEDEEIPSGDEFSMGDI